MPAVTITHNQGDAPVIPAAEERTVLIVQNNSPRDMRYRHFGPVSLTDASKRGLLLKAAGGVNILTGPVARRALYCVHGAGEGITEQLDYEADVIPS